MSCCSVKRPQNSLPKPDRGASVRNGEVELASRGRGSSIWATTGRFSATKRPPNPTDLEREIEGVSPIRSESNEAHRLDASFCFSFLLPLRARTVARRPLQHDTSARPRPQKRPKGVQRVQGGPARGVQGAGLYPSLYPQACTPLLEVYARRPPQRRTKIPRCKRSRQ